ncbi:LOW QUALITY PROTEIN: hypothetical protein MAR_025628, partial [Mya arenaria]
MDNKLEKMKANKDVWEAHLAIERTRKKLYRLRQRSEEQIAKEKEQNIIRQDRYRKRQREKGVKPKKNKQDKRPKTRHEVETQRKYWRTKKAESRLRRHPQKKRRYKESDREYRKIVRTPKVDPKPCKAMRQAVSRCKFPKSPRKFAATIEYALKKATPRKHRELEKSHIYTCVAKKKLKFITQPMYEVMKTSQSFRRNCLRWLAPALRKYRLQSTAAKLLGVRAATLTRYATYSGCRKKRCDTVAEGSKEEVKSFFSRPDISTSVPDRKRVNKHGEQRVLNRPLAGIYSEFKDDHPEVKVGFSTFAALKPRNVQPTTKQKWYSCLCDICTNVELKLVPLHTIASNAVQLEKKNHGNSDKLEKLENAMGVYQSVNATLCPYLGKFGRKACIDRTCMECGTDMFMRQFQDLLIDHGTDEVTYTKWERSSIVKRDGKEVTRTLPKSHKESLNSLVIELVGELANLAKHLFEAKWQQHQFSVLIKDIPQGLVVLNMDFAENYACIAQHEIQSAHWGHEQVTIHPSVAYYRCPEGECGRTIQEALIFVSDDKTHDAHAVHKFVTLANEHLGTRLASENGIERQIQFTDGCAAQYKSHLPFCDISHSVNDYGFVVERHFYGSRHGKGPSDGAGAVVKSSARRTVNGGNAVINTAKELFEHGKKNLTIEGDHLHSKRTFFYVSTEEINRDRPQRNAKTLPGTRALHCVKGIGPFRLETRTLSCFCRGCLIPTHPETECENIDYVEGFKPVVLRAVVPNQDRGQVEEVQIPPGPAQRGGGARVRGGGARVRGAGGAPGRGARARGRGAGGARGRGAGGARGRGVGGARGRGVGRARVRGAGGARGRVAGRARGGGAGGARYSSTDSEDDTGDELVSSCDESVSSGDELERDRGHDASMVQGDPSTDHEGPSKVHDESVSLGDGLIDIVDAGDAPGRGAGGA